MRRPTKAMRTEAASAGSSPWGDGISGCRSWRSRSCSAAPSLDAPPTRQVDRTFSEGATGCLSRPEGPGDWTSMSRQRPGMAEPASGQLAKLRRPGDGTGSLSRWLDAISQLLSTSSKSRGHASPETDGFLPNRWTYKWDALGDGRRRRGSTSTTTSRPASGTTGRGSTYRQGVLAAPGASRHHDAPALVQFPARISRCWVRRSAQPTPPVERPSGRHGRRGGLAASRRRGRRQPAPAAPRRASAGHCR